MIGFKAWYADGNAYQSSECSSCHENEFRKLPSEGLQILIIYGDYVGKQRTRRVLNGADWYWPWDCAKSKGWDSFVEPPNIDPQLLKKGTAMPDDQFKALWERAWGYRWA